MFKLIKYEYRKSLAAYITIFAILFAIEAYLAGSLLAKSEGNIAIAFILLTLVGSAIIICIMLVGIVQYSKELSTKTSYMTFMTPRSVYEIVGSKYLAFFITTVVGTALLGLFGYIDIKIATSVFPDLESGFDIFNSVIMIAFGKDVNQVLIAFLVLVLEQWISMIFTVSLAYFAITLSNTILSDKKGKGWLAVAFFIAMTIACNVISSHLPTFNFGDGIVESLMGAWPVLVFRLIMIAGTYFGVTELLKRKVSL